MKKIGIALLSVLTVSTALGGLATFNASAAVEDVPEKVESFNVALGKEVTFRDLLDVNTTLTMYNYYPNAGGIEGTGCYAMDGAEVAQRGGNHITDGVSHDWTGYKVNSTYANLAGWAYLDMGAEYAVEKVKVHMLAAWSFKDVIVQVSNDPNFEEGVTTVFSSCESLTLGEDVVYDGGLVGVTENIDLSGYTSNAVKSKQVDGNIFMANGATGRYVRVTNNNRGNGGADSNTNISELEVYVADSGIFAPTASVVSGTYESLTTIELSTGYADAEIYYTLDGSYPTKNSTKYEGPIDASAWTDAVALRAIAVVNGKQSEAADYVYKITVPSENKAFGKAVSFRSLTDMNTVLDAYAYYPDGKGDAFAGTGVYNLSWGDMGRLTDGNASWKSFQAHSTAPGVRGWAFLDLGEEIAIDNIQVGFLSAWTFDDVVIQVSNDPTFATGVTTVFASCASLSSGEVVVYSGGQVNCSTDTRAETGWNGNVSVNSANGALRTYAVDGVTARYVRLTDNTDDCGGATAETVFTEIQVWSKAGAVIADPEIKDTVKSVTAVENEISVTPGTTLEGVKAELPATVSYTTMKGATGEVALTWESADWTEATAGTYTFTATPVLAVDDVFDIIPASYSVSVTVNEDENANKVRFVSISMAGDIGLNFYVALADVTEATATITMKGVETSVAGVYQDSLSCWKFTYGVAPKDYKEIVTISVVDVVAEYSVAAYANALPETNNAYPMVAELMEYCEAARIYFAGETATATEDLTVDLSVYKATISGEEENVTIAGTTLVLESKTTINIYFTADSLDGLTCVVNGAAVTPIQLEGGQYVISISGIVSKDLDRVYSVQIGGYTVTYCALSYVETTLSQGTENVALANLVKALYALSVEAEEYFATVA